MADDLVFPPSEPFGDLDQNMLNEDVLITDLLNIPQIVPPLISPSDEQQRLFRAHSAHSIINSNTSRYAPISQLMKQTEQLTASLEQPLSRNMNQPTSTFSTMQTSHVFNLNNLQNQMLNNSGNYTNSSPNAQCLVIGGQRIAVPAPQQNSTLLNHMQTVRTPNIMNSSQQMGDQILRPQSVLNSNINTSTVSKGSAVNSIQSMNNSLKIGNNLINTGLNSHSSNDTNSPSSITNSNAGSTISSTTMKKPDSLRGQIVKTADQRLMLITEVNGKRVMYVIKPNSDSNSANNQSGITLTETTGPLPLQTQNVMSENTNRLPQHNIINVSLPSLGLNNNILNTMQSATSFSSPSHAVCSLDTSLNSNFSYHSAVSPKNENITPLTINNIQTHTNININSKDYALKIKEKLKNLHVDLSKLKSPINLPTMDSKSLLSKIPTGKPRTVFVNPVQQRLNTNVNRIVDDFDTALKYSSNNSAIELDDNDNNEEEDYEVLKENDNDGEGSDEDGQEIEFSENDITANDGAESVDTKSYVSEDSNQRLSSDDDDSLPLSHLKHEVDDPMQESPASRERTLSTEGGDSIPLSVVAASLKKGTTAKKKPVKATKGKKKKKDPREPVKPVRAYQVFFRELQAEIKEKEPQLTFGEISKKIAGIWEKLDVDKKKFYQDNHAAAKAEYDKKMIEYQDTLAQESNSVEVTSPQQTTSSGVSNDVEMEDDKENPSKKVVKRNKKRKKKTPPATKMIIESQTVDGDLLAEVNDSDEIPIETINDAQSNTKKVKQEEEGQADDDAENVDTPSSPSLPSSDSSAEQDDEDSESAISRIRRQAADMIKQIKEEKGKEKKGSAKHKAKELSSKKSKSSNSTTKMLVETISEKMLVETISETEEIQLPTKKPPLEKMRRIEKRMGKKSDSTKVSSTEPTDKSKNLKEEIKEHTPATSKPAFKIPKKSSGDNNIQSVGPRLCIRDDCTQPAKLTRERGAQYCSNECLVLYCREVFDSWILERQSEGT